MRLLKIYCILLVIWSVSLTGCKKLIEPENDNHLTLDFIKTFPAYAEGIMLRAYAQMPTNSFSFVEVATDDAVSNDKASQYLRMATGEWSALYTPTSQWSNSLSAIQYINEFLTIVEDVPWKPSNPSISDMFMQRYTGEAYAMRAWFEYILLQDVAGVGANDQLLGIPIYTAAIKPGDNFNVLRASFTESVAQIYDDIDNALEFITMDDFNDINDPALLPARYASANTADYNIVFGRVNMGRINGRIIKALRGRVALLAASPAYNSSDLTAWETAANYAAATLNGIGGIAGMDPNGHRWYEAARVNAVSLPNNESKEMLWRGTKDSERDIEAANFPPSLFGNGRVNPTQNLVNAFGMVNGYPISDPSYDPANPYAGRDPRLALYIIYNGNNLKTVPIYTGVGGAANAKDSLPTSTRTGYYMKKLMREDVNLNPVGLQSQNHYDVHLRYTEIFLNYAEAANEAWGPDGTGPNTYSARDVIRAIRARAGINQPDGYLNSLITKDEMRVLIRNERRIELCFEGHRLNDLRRWKADMTQTARGVNTNRAGSVFTYVDVEPRAYDNNYMYYAPIPHTEILKFNAIIQNKGW